MPVVSTIFTGKVRGGKGRHAEMALPGALSLDQEVEGWPDAVVPGSLNVKIDSGGFADGFNDPGIDGMGIARLDDGVTIRPTFVLPWNRIINNSLGPTPHEPIRGTGQFWRARLDVVATGVSADCFVFRRIGSSIKAQLELVGAVRFRDELSLLDGALVTVTFIDAKRGLHDG